MPTTSTLYIEDDIYLAEKLSALLPLLAKLNEIIHAHWHILYLSEDQILVKDLPANDARRIAKELIVSDDSLFTTGELVDNDDVFVIDSMPTVGVPFGTEARAFVPSRYMADKYRQILADIDQLDPFTDGFIHYQLDFARPLVASTATLKFLLPPRPFTNQPAGY